MAGKLVGFIAAALFLSVPLAASAQELVPLQPAPEQLLAREAFIKSQTEGVPVACVVKTSKTSVSVNEPFSLWWGSYGAEESGWAPTGAYTILAQKAGVYEYKFSFRGHGTSTTCRSTVLVS